MKTMCHTLKGTVDSQTANAIAKNGNNFVRLSENKLKVREFNDKARRRKKANAKLKTMKCK
jgi:hypothetical protein